MVTITGKGDNPMYNQIMLRCFLRSSHQRVENGLSTNLWWLFLQDGAWLSEDAVDDMAKVKKKSQQSEWRCCLLGMFVYVCIVYTCIYYICKIMVIQHSRLQRLVIHLYFLRGSPLVTLQEWFGYLGTLGCSTRLSVCCSFPMIFKILVCQIIRYCQISTIVTTIIVFWFDECPHLLKNDQHYSVLQTSEHSQRVVSIFLCVVHLSVWS